MKRCKKNIGREECSPHDDTNGRENNKKIVTIKSAGCDSREYTNIREECLVWKDRILRDEEQLKLR
jgi:hypothetical protein